MYMYFTSENHMYIYVDINENKMIKLMHIEIVGHEMDREEGNGAKKTSGKQNVL